MDLGFAISGALAATVGLLYGSRSSAGIFAPRFFPPCLAATVISALRLAMTSHHQVGQGNFSLKLSDILGTHDKGRATPHPSSSARNQSRKAS
jgi:hypothetical protein